MDAERRGVHWPAALDHRALVINQDQVGDLDLAEAHAERVHPEPVSVLRVARGDVAGHAFGETEPAEDPERRGELLLAMQPLLRQGVEDRRLGGRYRAGGGCTAHSG